MAKIPHVRDERADRHQQGSADISSLPLHPVVVAERHHRIATAAVQPWASVWKTLEQTQPRSFLCLEKKIVETHMTILVGENSTEPFFKTRHLRQARCDLHRRLVPSSELGASLYFTAALLPETSVKSKTFRFHFDKESKIGGTNREGGFAVLPAQVIGDQGLALLIEFFRRVFRPHAEALRSIPDPSHLSSGSHEDGYDERSLFSALPMTSRR